MPPVRNPNTASGDDKQRAEQSFGTTANWIRKVLGVALSKVGTREEERRNKSYSKTGLINLVFQKKKTNVQAEREEI